MTAEKEHTRGAVQRFAWRYRYQLAPIYLLVGNLVLGMMLHESPDGVKWSGIGGAAALVAVTIYSLGWLDRTAEQVYATTATVLTAGWLWLAARDGVTETLALSWCAIAAVLALPWWWHFRIRRDGARAKDQPVIPSGEAEQTWAEFVGNDKGVLPGSYLTDVRRIPHGWAATIVLPRGLRSTEDAIAATDRVTSAYQMPVGSLSIEATTDGNAAHARLTVLNENPLHKGQLFKGPSLDPATGTATVGVYGDGTPAQFRFWMPGSGPVHSLVSGTTGSGKSRFLDQLLAEARHSGRIVTWMIDPQGGQSLPRWVDSVDWAALSSADGLAMLQAAHDVMHARSRHLARMEYVDAKGRTVRGIDFFDPTPEFPLLMLVLEEAHDILRRPSTANGPVSDRDNAIKLVEDIGKMGRKCGVFVVLATQMPSVKELGESSALRSMVSSGNVVVFRTSDRLTGNMAFSGSLPVDPSRIPRSLPDGSSSGGMGYIVGPSSRTVLMRAFFVEDPYEWATTGEPARLDALSVAAAGPAYMAGRNWAEEEEPVAIEAPVVPAFAPPAEPGEAWVDSADLEPDPDPEPISTPETVPSTVPLDVPSEPVRITAVDAVREAIASNGGTARMYHLAEATGYSPRMIHNAVKTLVADGVVEKVRHGEYALTDRSC